MTAPDFAPPRLAQRLLRLTLSFVAGWLLEPSALAAIAPGQLEFFETKVRPILTQQCYGCHSDSQGKVKAGLELDWKEGWEKGGTSGSAIVPGDPEKSLLIKAVRYTDPDLQMPPKGKKLSPAQVADLVSWVKMGAPDPRHVKPSALTAKAGGQTNHWSFLPVKEPKVPSVKEAGWIKTPVDAFILQKLEENGLSHAPPADKQTLLRRVYFDLIGLPPTPAELDAFLSDSSPSAYETVVDHLLSSAQYGERWGRHWLDVARYSDTKGQFKRQQESSLYPYAWTYRDYVVEAFNHDMPFDQFVREQIAADKLPRGHDNRNLAALGFLTVGEHFAGNVNDIINDRIDVVSKGFLGLTVSCARCHDHRFDPIPQSDYYSWHGIFSSSVEPAAKPLLGGATTNSTAYADYVKVHADLESRLHNVSTSMVATVFGDAKRYAAVYLFATTLPPKEQEAYLTRNGADPELTKNWQQLIRIGTRRELGVFRLWQFLQRIPAARFPEQSRRALAGLTKDDRTRFLPSAILDTFQGKAPRSLAEVAALYGTLFSKPDPTWQATLDSFLFEGALIVSPNRAKARYLALREQFDRLELTHEGSPARPMLMVDSPAPKDSAVFIRGEAGNQGPVVPRRFLEVLSGPSRAPFTSGSGRLQLAQAIANPNNPLTARVWVNRVWMHHFGEGFVTTPDDFGNQSAPPSHPELLDWLASRFVKEGESTKKLHKLIVLSNTYQQQATPSSPAQASDPANRLLSHFSTRRLEFEPLRDSILYISGKLDLTQGGKPVDLSEGLQASTKKRQGLMDRMGMGFQLSTAQRRSIYGFIDRVDLLEMLNTFDFANPAMESGKRYETAVPQQALFLMNSPLVVEQARNLVSRGEFESLSSDESKIALLYRKLFQRNPTAEEQRLGQEFLERWQPPPAEVAPAAPVESASVPPKKRPRDKTPAPRAPLKGLDKWAEYTHALMMTTEMSFVN